MVKDETLVTSTAINPIFNELFEALMLLQILRYFMGIPKGIHKKNKIKSKHYLLYFRWFEVGEYSKNFNCNDMFASLHALK